MMRQATDRTRLRVPAMGANPRQGLPPAYSTGNDTRLAQAAQQETPNIMPPQPPVQHEAPQMPTFPTPPSFGGGGQESRGTPGSESGASPQSWTPPPGLMTPGSERPGQPMPRVPGQMRPGMPFPMPGQVPPPRHTILPPGMAANPNDYAYEPQSDRTWKMYPPGVASPPHGYQASMPRAASTADLARMAQELGPYMQRREQLRQSTQAPVPPGFGPPTDGVMGS